MVDLAIIAVLLVSGAIAFLFGVVREVFFVAGFAAAGFAAYYGLSSFQGYAREYIGTNLIADIATAVTLFVVTLVVVVLIGFWLSRLVRKIGLGVVDRSLGFLYGLARGALVVCIAYIVTVGAIPPDEQPEWLHDASALPLVQYGAELVVLAIPLQYRPEWAGAIGEAESLRGGGIDPQRSLERLINPPPPAEEPSREGYTEAERKPLDRLIKNLDSQ